MDGSDVFIQLFGWCATVMSILLFFAPAPTFWSIVQTKSVGNFDSLPYLVSLLQCLLWFSYCHVTPGMLPVLISCTVGIVLQSIWCVLFFRFSLRPGRVTIIIRITAVMAVWFTLTVLDLLYVPSLHVETLKKGESLQSEVVGLSATVVNVWMLGAPLGIVRHVIRTQSVEFMPFSLSAMVVVSSAFWVAFAMMKQDMWVFLPNALGFALGGAQLIVYARYCRRNVTDVGLEYKDPNLLSAGG